MLFVVQLHAGYNFLNHTKIGLLRFSQLAIVTCFLASIMTKFFIAFFGTEVTSSRLMFSVGKHDDVTICALGPRSSGLGLCLTWVTVFVEMPFTLTVPLHPGV